MSMWAVLDAADQAAFNFDPHGRRLADVHQHDPPAVDRAATRVPRPRRARTARSTADATAPRVLSPERHLAAFDLENTLISSNVVESYSFLATRRLNVPERMRYVLRTLAEAPERCSSMDRKDRGDFLRYFYRRYEDAPVDQIDEDSKDLLAPADPHQELPGRPAPCPRAPGARPPHGAHHRRARLRRRGTAAAVRRDRRRQDDACVPTAPTAATCRRCRRRARPGHRCSPTTARPKGLKLEESIAYADSTSDLPMLEGVGFPVAVNPETRLAAIARKRGWLVEEWSKASGAPKPLLPIGNMLSERERRRVVLQERAAMSRAARSSPQAGAVRAWPGWPAMLMPGRGAARGPAASSMHRRDAPPARRPAGCACTPHLAGICGSDLATVDGTPSAYFDDWVSFPFVPGHEVVGRPRRRHRRVVIEPVLGHASPAASSRRSRALRPATATTRATSPPATSSPASRSGSAAPPVAAGPRVRRPREPAPRRPRLD